MFTLGTYLGIPSLLDVLDWTHSGKRDAALAPHKRGKEGRREGASDSDFFAPLFDVNSSKPNHSLIAIDSVHSRRVRTVVEK